MEIPLTQGKVAQINDEDWPLVSQYTWHAKREKGGKWYAAATVWNPATKRHESLRMHRLIVGAGPDQMVDHKISPATLDNRRSNLRVCSNAQNQQNSGPRQGTSRYKGVSWIAKKGRRLAQFRHNGQYHYLGYFDDEVEAARAYLDCHRFHYCLSIPGVKLRAEGPRREGSPCRSSTTPTPGRSSPTPS